MNKLKFSILIGACAVMATACEDKLDEPQKGVIYPEQFYQSDADAQNALNGMYDEFGRVVANANLLGIHNAPFFAYNLCGDDIYAAGEFYGDNDFMSQLNEFRYATDHEDLSAVYKAYYSAIYAANLVINNVEKASELTDYMKRCVAEARVIRAYCHMQLGIGWYDPPKVTEAVAYNAEGLANSVDHNELLEWCGDECAAAVNDLDERKGASDKDGTIKVTKGFAQFVAGKAYMFAGKFDKSKEALKPLVESPNYALVPGDRIGETFRCYGDGNEEQIMATNIAENKSVDIWSGMINRSVWMYCNIMNWRTDHFEGLSAGTVTGWGGLGIREDFAADFIKNDCGIDPGDPNTKAGMVGGDAEIGKNSIYDPYAYKKDPKKDERWRRKAWMRNIEEVLYEMSGGSPTDKSKGIKSYLYGQTHFLEYKRQFLVDELYKDEAFPKRNILLARLGEAYLLYAEACARTGDNAEGLKYLNLIQERAGSATVTKASDDLLAAVKQEKRFEMFVEGCRWPDMVRWSEQDKGDGVDYFERIRKNGETVPQLYDALYVPNDATDDRFYVKATHPNAGRGEVGFKEPSDAPNKYKYYPIPFVEMNSNNNIKQHDGWK